MEILRDKKACDKLTGSPERKFRVTGRGRWQVCEENEPANFSEQNACSLKSHPVRYAAGGVRV